MLGPARQVNNRVECPTGNQKYQVSIFAGDGGVADFSTAWQDCVDWTSSSAGDDGVVGLIGSRDQDEWSWQTTSPCSNYHHMYCFQQSRYPWGDE